MNNIVTSLCLAYMVALVAGMIIRACRLGGLDRLKFIKNFKKGNFVWIYFVAIPLHMLGMAYDGQEGLGLFLNAVKSSVEIVVLKFDYDTVCNLAAANTYYQAVLYLCFILVTLNAFMFTFAIFGEKLINAIRLSSAKRNDRVYVFVGYNERTRMIIDSVVKKNEGKKAKDKVVLLAEVDSDTVDELFVDGVAVKKFGGENLSAVLEKICGKFDDKIVNVILNAENDTLNLVYCKELGDVVKRTGFNGQSIDNPKGIIAYVFGDEQNEYAFTRIVEETKGCVRYVNKYKLVAMDFLDRYPLTKFMAEEHIDYSTATVRPDVDVNVVMIGFGKTGQQLFLTSVENNQFLTKDGSELKHKKVDYFIYDREESDNDKDLNHNYYRYTKEFMQKSAEEKKDDDGELNDVFKKKEKEVVAKLEGKEPGEDYFPLPDAPANVSFEKVDINDTSFYGKIKENLTSENGHIAVNNVIIAFGSDLDNLDLAEKVAVKIREWGFDKNTKVFVKIRNDDLYDSVLAEDYEKNGDFIVFGGERRSVYHVDKIVNHEVDLLARRRHVCYQTEYAEVGATAETIEKGAIETWYKNPQFKRESDVYACMSIRMKLNLLGYDFAGLDSPDEDKTEEFFKAYQKDDEIVYQLDKSGKIKTLQDKEQVDYGKCEFKRGTIRNNLATQEHERWNAYMICCGFIPATKEEIRSYLLNGNKDEFEKNYRKHGNLTTYDGLIEFKNFKAEVVGKEPEKCDVIKYDYQIMDDVRWLLKKRGCKVVLKKDRK